MVDVKVTILYHLGDSPWPLTESGSSTAVLKTLWLAEVTCARARARVARLMVHCLSEDQGWSCLRNSGSNMFK